MSDSGISVHYGPVNDSTPDYETLLITDIPEIASSYPDSLICIKKDSDIDNFPGSQYFVMNPEDNDADYFIKIWQRFKNIPWEIARTQRLIIRETIPSDVDVFATLYDDPDMTRFTEPLYEDLNEEKKYILEYTEKVYKIQGFGIWTLLEKESNSIIGRAGLITRGGFDGVEVGFLLGKQYRNKGYATEAVNECIKIAHNLEIDKIYSLTMPENTKARRVLSKCGFHKTGTTSLSYREYEIWTQK